MERRALTKNEDESPKKKVRRADAQHAVPLIDPYNALVLKGADLYSGSIPIQPNWTSLLSGVSGSIGVQGLSIFGADGIPKLSEQAAKNLQALSKSSLELGDKIAALRKEVTETARKLEAEKEETARRQGLEAELQQQIGELKKKQELAVVLQRIHPEATSLLLESSAFKDKLLGGHACKSFVLSVDIRRSTELMLKARTPQLYANFITQLAIALRDSVIEYQGVFDKFTGDGILAFFPDFYSGEDAGLRAVACAEKCHEIFRQLYERSRHCFQVVPLEIGLGVGIDFGDTHLVTVGDGLTVVGVPVVYACRIGGAPAGTTLVNQPAFEQLFPAYSAQCRFSETAFEAKHEGALLVHAVQLATSSIALKEAAWRSIEADAAPAVAVSSE